MAECRAALEAVKIVVAALVDFVRQHGGCSGASGSNRKSATQDNGSNGGGGLSSGQTAGKYKVSMCRDLALRGTCPRSNSCTFAHSDTELDKYVQLYILYIHLLVSKRKHMIVFFFIDTGQKIAS